MHEVSPVRCLGPHDRENSREEASGVSLFSAIPPEDMQTAQIVTGLTMAAFIGVRFVPGLRERAGLARGVLLAVYLAASAAFVGHVLMRQ
jgi:hypothetical protein